MNDIFENEKKNYNLKKLYQENTKEFLKVWHKHYDFKSPERINEFGIVDVNSYEADNGILFIGKETNGWDYSKGETFLSWIKEMATNNKVTGPIASRHPQIWYNLGRWSKFISNPEIDKQELINQKEDALSGLKMIAFTNLNKAEGKSASGKAFWGLIKEDIVINLLSREIKEIAPKFIVLCGIKKKHIPKVIQSINKTVKIIEMPHPTARNISKMDMLTRLEENLR